MPREKSPATPGIDPGTFRLVAQCLKYYSTPGPDNITVFLSNTGMMLRHVDMFCFGVF